MSKVVLDVSMSLDGFTAGPNVRAQQPMGDGGERPHGEACRPAGAGCRCEPPPHLPGAPAFRPPGPAVVPP